MPNAIPVLVVGGCGGASVGVDGVDGLDGVDEVDGVDGGDSEGARSVTVFLYPRPLTPNIGLPMAKRRAVRTLRVRSPGRHYLWKMSSPAPLARVSRNALSATSMNLS